MRIIVDAMGGDNAPEAAVWGGALAAKEYGEEILLVGQPEVVANVLKEKGLSDIKGVTIMPANDLVDMHDDPATVLRHKPDSSMAVAFKLLKAGEGDALVSAGNTGALLTGATLYGGRIKGIRRGALAPVMPCANGQVMLCDAGANTECTAEMLLQFAFLASLYAEKINGVVKPRVGLVNNGTEDTKGDPLRKEAYALLKKAGDEGRLNFVGNVEGSMVPLGACDVAVCDGFTGNVQLKTIEGVAKFMAHEIKGVFMASVGTKLGIGIAQASIAGIMSLCGYLSSTGSAVTQPQSAIDSIINIYMFGPLLIFVGVLIVGLLYQLDKKYPAIMKELAEREACGEL